LKARRLIAIGGHPRSGTTLLTWICALHPAMMVTHEFGTFRDFGGSYDAHVDRLRRPSLGNRTIIPLHRFNRTVGRLASLWFRMRYTRELKARVADVVDDLTIEATMRSIFPQATVVGDKFPGYVFDLDQLTASSRLLPVIIYRDCRDVTESALRMSRGQWKRKAFRWRMDTAAKVARRWVRAVRQMHEHQDSVHIIRYEDLIRSPAMELGRLGEVLDIDPTRFPLEIITTDRIGSHRKGLTSADLDAVMNIAGSTMIDLGYE
jgi:hypothetical protein